MNTHSSKLNAVVVIPTYTNTRGLQETLRHLNHIGPYPVIVVNNNPENPLIDLPEIDPSAVLTEKKNQGFAKAVNDGCNEAIVRYCPQYLVILNDDVVFSQDWIHECIRVMHANKWSATAPVLKRLDASIENAGYRVLKHGKIALERDANSGRRVDGITAAAMVIDVETFVLIDGFDESFFAYLEDVDLCLRMTKIGKTFGVTKTAEVTHLGQQTSSRMSRQKAILDYKNWHKLIKRHWSTGDRIKHLPHIFIERLRNISGILKAK